LKKSILLLVLASLLIPVFAQEENQNQKSAETASSDLNVELDPVTGFPVIKKKPFVCFNEGISYTNVNRYIKNDTRSNYMWTDHMIGAFFEVQSVNMKPCNSLISVSAYYPFKHYFNKVEQIPKQTILYAFDLYAGPFFEADMWKYVQFKFGAGLHYMYQLSDEWHLNYLGAGAMITTELPIAWHWTGIINGKVTLDNANLGTNKLMQPYDYSWQYGVSIGVRYSRKHANEYSYIRSNHIMKPKKHWLKKLFKKENPIVNVTEESENTVSVES